MEETEIISLVREGNIDAFSKIVEQYQTPLQRYLYRMTGDHDLAEDMAQDTFVRAYKSILKTEIKSSFKAWLYRIAENNARQYFRRRKLISFLPFFGNEESELSADGFTEETENSIVIEETLLRIPQKLRSCLVLHFMEGLKYREIAEIMGISEEAVRKRVSRGSKEFKRLYDLEGGVR